MRILIIANAESVYTVRFANQFTDDGHAVALLSQRLPSANLSYRPGIRLINVLPGVTRIFRFFFKKQIEGFKSYSNHFLHPANFLTFIRFLYLRYFINYALRNEKFDAIFSTNLTNGGYLASLINRNVAKVCQTLGFDLNVATSILEINNTLSKRQQSLKGNDFIVTGPSDHFVKVFKDLGIYDEKKVIFHPGLGVDTSTFNAGLRSALLRNELYGLKESDILAVCFRPVRKVLDFEGIIENLPVVIKTYPNFFFAIGTGGTDVTYLKDLAAQLKISQHILFIDNLQYSELPRYLAQGDIFIDPVNAEKYPETVDWGVSGAFLEAAACGLIPVSSIRSNIHSYLPANAHPFLYQKYAQQSEAIIRAIHAKENYTLRQDISAFIHTNFSWQTTINLYYKLMTQKQA